MRFFGSDEMYFYFANEGVEFDGTDFRSILP